MADRYEEGGVSLKKEFRLHKFGLSHDKPHLFALSAWKCSHNMFIVWRAFWALWHTGWLIRSILAQVASEDYPQMWFIYLTNWSYLILTIQSILHLSVVLYHYRKGRKTEEDFQDLSGTGRLEKVTWVFTAVAFEDAIVVTLMYWMFIFNGSTNALDVSTHAVTSLYVLFEMFISATPHRFLHFIYGSGFGLIYTIFTVVYHFCEGTNNLGEPYIYDLIDWSSPGWALAICLGLILVVTPIVQLFVFGLYALRAVLGQRCSGCRDGIDKTGESA